MSRRFYVLQPRDEDQDRPQKPLLLWGDRLPMERPRRHQEAATTCEAQSNTLFALYNPSLRK
jgi:hypothetical protein